MTGKERIYTALNHGTPDRVPATPDISIMIPTVLAGKRYYDLFDQKAAYIKAAKHFGIDGWLFDGTLKYITTSKADITTKLINDDFRAKVYKRTLKTPDGELYSKIVAMKDAPETETEKFCKDFAKDHKIIRHLFDYEITGYDKSIYEEQLKMMGDQGIICCTILSPGIQNFITWIDVESAIYAYYDHPEIFEELRELAHKQAIRQTEMAIDAGVECILTGGSGSITLQSPEIFRDLCLPTIKEITRMAKQAGVLTGVHSCGKEYELVKMMAEETDLDYINPLEIPPMGDCDLAKVKKEYGQKLSLMGNLHTTKVMLTSRENVRLESLKAIKAAGEGGGFVLSTGDQCGGLTPFENIFEMVEVAKEFGTYPLNIDKIDTEIERLTMVIGENPLLTELIV